MTAKNALQQYVYQHIPEGASVMGATIIGNVSDPYYRVTYQMPGSSKNYRYDLPLWGAQLAMFMALITEGEPLRNVTWTADHPEKPAPKPRRRWWGDW